VVLARRILSSRDNLELYICWHYIYIYIYWHVSGFVGRWLNRFGVSVWAVVLGVICCRSNMASPLAFVLGKPTLLAVIGRNRWGACLLRADLISMAQRPLSSYCDVISSIFSWKTNYGVGLTISENNRYIALVFFVWFCLTGTIYEISSE
jgi:hypothetical protein